VFDPDSPGLTVGVIGAGTMGRGIAQVCAVAGYPVVLQDSFPGVAQEGFEFIQKILARSVEKGRLSNDAADEAMARISLVDTLEGMSDCGVVIEAAAEIPDIKKGIFRALDEIVSEDAVLATNTSSLSVTEIAAATRLPERVVGLHFFNPPPLMALVELIFTLKNSPQLIDNINKFVENIGKTPIRIKDSPGFVVNHVGRALATESFAILSEGVAEPVDIDRILRDAAGFKMGPFELLDLTGLDISHPVTEQIFAQFYNDPFYRPSEIAEARVASGVTGRKTGAGFYEYRDGKAVIPSEAALPEVKDVDIWLDPNAPAHLGKVLSDAGATIIEAFDPPATAVCVVTPIGSDATTAAVELNLDPKRTVAVDTFIGADKRWTVMTTPLTDPSARDAVWALLAADGTPVTLISDSAGFVTQRVIAMVVNLGCQVAAKRVAAPEDIDTAVKLGLNYPFGPLEWGDKVGPEVVLDILDDMFDFTHDPRYRASPWLRRRVMLGASLLTPNSLPNS
jgi:3-hydroxybutyryl-CoA dehydrogenase